MHTLLFILSNVGRSHRSWSHRTMDVHCTPHHPQKNRFLSFRKTFHCRAATLNTAPNDATSVISGAATNGALQDMRRVESVAFFCARDTPSVRVRGSAPSAKKTVPSSVCNCLCVTESVNIQLLLMCIIFGMGSLLLHQGVGVVWRG